MLDFYSPEQVAQHEAARQASLEKGKQLLDQMTTELGYTKVSLAELGLTPEEIKKTNFARAIREENPDLYAYQTTHQDGSLVKVVVLPAGRGMGPDYDASIFSVAFHQGVAKSNDYNPGGLQENLQIALKSKYPET